jgi:Reverse transcriptase (RNA-dependent DNA polymerase)
MPFGLSNAPMHFQWCMEDIINGGVDAEGRQQRKLDCQVYLDDFTIQGDSMDDCLRDTLDAVLRLMKAGAMVSLKKSVIGATEGKILGHRWRSGGYFTPEGSGLKALLELDHKNIASIPRQSIYGLLSFFRPYVPDFATRTEPLRKLLSGSHKAWT